MSPAAQQPPRPYGLPTHPDLVEVTEQVTAVVRADGYPMDRLPILFDAVFSRLLPALAEAGVQPAGPAFALYAAPPAGTVDIEVGLPVDGVLRGEAGLGSVEVPGHGEVDLHAVASALPGGRVGAATHQGGFDGLGAAWGLMMSALEEKGETPGVPFWEIYVTEPSPDMDPAQLRTDLFTTLLS